MSGWVVGVIVGDNRIIALHTAFLQVHTGPADDDFLSSGAAAYHYPLLIYTGRYSVIYSRFCFCYLVNHTH